MQTPVAVHRPCLPQTIQRHWREYRLRCIRQQQTEGYQVGAGCAPAE